MTAANSFHLNPLAGALGCEVRGIDLSSVAAREAEAILDLLLTHHVLFFPDQHLSAEAEVAFGKQLGPIENHPHLTNPTAGLPNGVFELAASHGGIADEWHTDLTFLERPALYSILNMVKAPPVGGDTLWANTGLAFDALSPPIQALCQGLTAVHDAEPHGRSDESFVHPVVRRNPHDGRPILYVNEHFTRRIREVSHTESDLLLNYLTRWISQPRFTVRYRWAEGTLAIWDNRITQHFVVADFDRERVIQRVTVMGDRVERFCDAQDWPVFERRGLKTDTSRHDSGLKDAE